ncbi:hypothetical protein [uncultured Nostoc sp.]|uniref:DUF7219 family protein n=1 Tax=uncultured Nostoc sp. TaxID=340711 RepID=UPI0035CB7EE6
MNQRSDLLYALSPYYRQFQPESLVFNAKLQDFTQRINYICSLQTGGKLSPEEAYK